VRENCLVLGNLKVEKVKDPAKINCKVRKGKSGKRDRGTNSGGEGRWRGRGWRKLQRKGEKPRWQTHKEGRREYGERKRVGKRFGAKVKERGGQK